MITKNNDICLGVSDELKNNSAPSTQNSELGEAAWLKEIQR